MSIVSGAMVYFIIWWVVLFAVLPFGVQTDGNIEKGFASSAPKNPHLRKKFLATTLITAFIWGIIQFIMVYELVRLL
jgi:predicted secreted protein